MLNSWKLVTACLYELATSYLDRDNGLSMPARALNHPVDIWGCRTHPSRP